MATEHAGLPLSSRETLLRDNGRATQRALKTLQSLRQARERLGSVTGVQTPGAPDVETCVQYGIEAVREHLAMLASERRRWSGWGRAQA